MTMDAINAGAKAINDGIAYLKSNAWPIAFMLALWFFIKPRVIDAMDDVKSRRSPQKIKEIENDLRRVRELQQQKAEQEAKTKAKELKEKKVTEVVPEKKAKKKAKPASSAKSTPSISMNNFSSGPSYRPQRRTVRRG